MASINSMNSFGISNETKRELIQKIKVKNGPAYLQKEHLPLFFSDVTNWKGQPLIPILDFLNQLEHDEVPEAEH